MSKIKRTAVTNRERSLIHNAFMCGITNDYIDMVLEDNKDKDPESECYPEIEEVAFEAWFKDNYLIRSPSEKTAKLQKEKPFKLQAELEKSLDRLKTSTEDLVKTQTTPSGFLNNFKQIRNIFKGFI